MRAGRLDRTVVVERMTATLDAFRVPVETWTPHLTLRAEIVEADDAQADPGSPASLTVTLRTRFVADLTLADRVVLDDEPREIIGMREIGRRRGLELRTRAWGEP